MKVFQCQTSNMTVGNLSLILCMQFDIIFIRFIFYCKTYKGKLMREVSI